MRELILESDLENLVIFRHGKAQRPYEAKDDFERELIERGKKEAYNQALRLQEAGFTPDLFLVSTAARAAQTFESAEPVFPNVKFQMLDELYLASYKKYLTAAITSGAKNVVVIAHDPGLHELCRFLMSGNDLKQSEQMLLFELPTSGIAWFRRNEKMPNAMHLAQYFKTIKTAD